MKFKELELSNTEKSQVFCNFIVYILIMIY